MKIKFITTGGTIDKVYFDQKSEFQIGDPQVIGVLQEANVSFVYEVVTVLRKDSLDMTDEDRRLIYETVESDPCQHIVVTHGTDTMIHTARMLKPVSGKTVVLTGAMQPAKFRFTDAIFNIACAVTAVQTLPPGVYIAMNGQIFDPEKSRKNVAKNRFEMLE